MAEPTPAFDYTAARAFLQRKHSAKRSVERELFQKAQKDFASIREMLVREYRPLRVYQWGSLLDANRFHDYSDIDIAVEGVASAEEFFEMHRRADDMTEFHLDMVQIEKIEPIHADSIRKKGRLVYERNE